MNPPYALRIFSALILLTVALPAYGQPNENSAAAPFRLWASSGLTVGSLNGEPVNGWELNVNGGRTWLFQAGYRHQSIGSIFDEPPSQNTIGLGLGRGASDARGVVAAFVGPVVAWGRNSENQRYTKPGAAVNGQFRLRLFSHVGFGVGVYATWVPGAPTGGVSLNLGVGNGR